MKKEAMMMNKFWKILSLGEVLQKTETVCLTKNPHKEYTYVDFSIANDQSFKLKTILYWEEVKYWVVQENEIQFLEIHQK